MRSIETYIFLRNSTKEYKNNEPQNCVRKNKCVTWKRLKERRSLKNWLDTSSPDFGSYKPEVEIIYLNSNNDPKLNIGLLELWDGFFEDIGISSIKKEAETSTSF